MACILLMSSAVRVHDSQAYRKMDVKREYLSVEATKTLVSSLVLSRLDYCNAVLAGSLC